MIEKMNRFLDLLSKLIKWFVAILIFLAIGLSFIEIVRRYLFGMVFSWSDEFVRYCLIYVALVGGAAAYREGQLVCFDSLLNKVKPSIRKAFFYASSIITLISLIVFFVLSIKTVTQSSVIRGISPGLRVPMTVPYFAFVIGFLLMIIFCIEGIVNEMFGSKNKEKET